MLAVPMKPIGQFGQTAKQELISAVNYRLRSSLGRDHICHPFQPYCHWSNKYQGKGSNSDLFTKSVFVMSSHEMWRHTLVILLNVKCPKNGWSDVQTPPPPPPLNSIWFCWLRKFSCQALGCWWGVVCHGMTYPTTTTPKFVDLENVLVKLWGGGGGVYHAMTYPPTTITPKFVDLEKFHVKLWGGGGGWYVMAWPTTPTTTPKTQLYTKVDLCTFNL